jgi:uncharacterized membrane protein
MSNGQVAGVKVQKFFHRNLKIISFILIYIVSSVVVFYLAHGLVSAPVCECSVPLTWIVALISATGVIVGIAVYIYMKKTVIPETVSTEELQETTRFLPKNQRRIVEAVIDEDGEISQSELPEETGLSKVKISRKLKNLERQKIIRREENGMTKKVMLGEEFEELLL